MTSLFKHEPDVGRFVMPEGEHEVFADYRQEANTLLITHVEAAPALRGTGAADRFMRELTTFAREKNVKVRPLCAYAAAWYRRHPDDTDVVASGF